MSGIKIEKMTIDIPAFAAKSKKAMHRAQKKAAIQFLTWANAGSPLESATPPIRWGVLRGSSSAFVGSEPVYTYPQKVRSGAPDSKSPAIAYSGKDNIITVVWNTDYALKMHEEKGISWEELGPFSKQARDATDKWLLKHMNADKEALQGLIAKFFKEELGL